MKDTQEYKVKAYIVREDGTKVDLENHGITIMFSEDKSDEDNIKYDDYDVLNLLTWGEVRKLRDTIMDKNNSAYMSRKTVKALLQKHKYGNALSWEFANDRLSNLTYDDLVVLFVYVFYSQIPADLLERLDRIKNRQCSENE